MPRAGDLGCHSVWDTFGEGVVVTRWDGLVIGTPGDQQRDVGQ